MNAVLSPLISEFESKTTEARYTTWLAAKIERSRSSKKPLLAHDQVMAEARRLIDDKWSEHAAGQVA